MSKLVQLKRVTDEAWVGAKPPTAKDYGIFCSSDDKVFSRWAIFCNFLEKKATLNSGVAKGGRGGGPPWVSPFWGDTICFVFFFF